MSKRYELMRSVTITYVTVVEANSRDEALEIASDLDLDEWIEVDVDGDFSSYIKELEED